MKLILAQDVPSLGKVGDVVDVKEGYARNFLLPRGLAREATAGQMKSLTLAHEAKERRHNRELEDAQRLVAALQEKAVEVTAKAGEGGRLFGSITAADVADALSRRGFEISKKQISLEDPIKTIGSYKVDVKVSHGLHATVTLHVQPVASS
ncbi:MAG: 50S ribosomal protein L9 [Armatimonadetes bacterium]|nr:50S ribosomal protein L9 [Armatimonadota bacterium]